MLPSFLFCSFSRPKTSRTVDTLFVGTPRSNSMEKVTRNLNFFLQGLKHFIHFQYSNIGQMFYLKILTFMILMAID